MKSAIEALKAATWPGVKWDPAQKPVVVTDDGWCSIPELEAPIQGEAAYVVGVNDTQMTALCRWLETRAVHFYEMRVTDLGPLSTVAGLSELAIRWNTKVSDLGPLTKLSELRTLVLEDTPKVHDLRPVAGLQALRALEFSGGMWNKNEAETLEPVGGLQELVELHLTNVSLERDGLRPLAGCRSLERLVVSNQFATEDYAFLAARLPETECDMFAPFTRLGVPLNGKDVLITGRGKPFLNSKKDAERIDQYVKSFEAMRLSFEAGRALG